MTAPRSLLLLALLPLLASSATAADEVAAEAFKQLSARLDDPKTDREKLRQDLLTFQHTYPGTPHFLEAAGLLKQLPTPMDKLDPKLIPALERFDWQPKELVAVLGEHRGRHASAISSVAYSPNGKLVASGGASLVRLWDSGTLRLHTPPLGASTTVTAIAFSRDSKKLAAATAYGFVNVWDVTETPPKLIHTMKDSTTYQYGVVFSPDSKNVAAGGYDMQLRIWDITGKEPKILASPTAHAQAITALTYTLDGKGMATGSIDGTVKLWDLVQDTPKEKAAIKEHTGAVQSLVYAPDGKSVYSGGADGFLRVMNVTTGKSKTFVKTPAGIHSLSIAPGGKVLATGGADANIRLWDISATTPKERTVLDGHALAVTGVAFGPDGRSLISGSSDWTVRNWTLVGTKLSARPVMRGHLSSIYAAAVGPDGHSVATGGQDNVARVWELSGTEPKGRNIIKGDSFLIYALAYSADGKLLIAGNSVIARVWDPATGRPVRRFEGHKSIIYCAAWSGDGKHVLTGSHDMTVKLWDGKTGKELQTLSDYKSYVNSVAFSPDGTRAVSGSGGYEYDEKGRPNIKDGAYIMIDCQMRYWDVDSGREIKHYATHPKIATSATFGPDGKTALCAVGDAIRFYDLTAEGDKPVRNLVDRGGAASSMSYSPDGKMLVSVGPYASVRLWDAVAGKKVKEWTLPEYVRNAIFTADGRHLIITLTTGVAYVLRLEEAASRK